MTNNSSGNSHVLDLTEKYQKLQVKLLSAGINFLQRHIRNDDEVERRMRGNESFNLFCETQYHSKSELNKVFSDSVHDSSPAHVTSFILSILRQGIFSVAAFIISVIYLSRFKEASQICLHACTWRPLFLTTLLVANKMWEDNPVRNSNLTTMFPVLTKAELNKMENKLLDRVEFNVIVKPELFCNFCEKLLAESINQEITRIVGASDYASGIARETINVMTAVEEDMKNGKRELEENARKSICPGLTTAIQSFAIGRPRIGLRAKNFFHANLVQLGNAQAQENGNARTRSSGLPGTERKYGLNPSVQQLFSQTWR